jgi:hypothetical protein
MGWEGQPAGYTSTIAGVGSIWKDNHPTDGSSIAPAQIVLLAEAVPRFISEFAFCASPVEGQHWLSAW